MKKIISQFVLLLITLNLANAQSAAFSDPAQAFNKLMLDKNGVGGGLDRVGAYKVRGTAFYFGGDLPASIFLKDGSYVDVLVSYNTFTQVINIYDKSKKPLATKKVADVDSFKVGVTTTDYKANVKFVSSFSLGSNENSFFQPLAIGKKYSLYKKYKSDLGIVSDNILQSDLRQYDLLVDYYYAEEGVKGLKKIKLTSSGVTKEFKKIKDVSAIVDEGSFMFNPEAILLNVFESINQ